MKHSKYEAKQHKVVIDSNYYMHCTESRTKKETNKNRINPTEMIDKTKLLMLKHEGTHFEPLIDALMLTLDAN